MTLKAQVSGGVFDPDTLFSLIPRKLDGRIEGEAIVKSIWNSSQPSRGISDLDNPESRDVTNREQTFLQSLVRYNTEHIKKPEIGRVHVTTYRKAKGLESDLVVVTSVDSNDFFDNPQKRRLLYVASTRSKKNLILTFAEKRTKARRFTRGKDAQSKGNPQVFRSPLIPSKYQTQEYSEWINTWQPI